MKSKYKINWQDKYLCDTILSNKDELSEDELKFECSWWTGVLIKHYIVYEMCNGKSDNATIINVFNVKDNEKKILDKLKEYTLDDNRASSIMKGLKKEVEKMKDADTESKRHFFNDKPVLIYKSEIDKIRQMGKDFTYNSKNGKKPREILQKMIIVALVWQKTYQNQFEDRKDYVPQIEEKINNSKIYTLNGSESGTRIGNYQTLIEAGLIEYNRPEIEYNKRKKLPYLLYKVPFISYNDSGTDEVVLTITNFELLCEQVMSCFTEKLYVNECQKCNHMFVAKRPSTKNCDKCNHR